MPVLERTLGKASSWSFGERQANSGARKRMPGQTGLGLHMMSPFTLFTCVLVTVQVRAHSAIHARPEE